VTQVVNAEARALLPFNCSSAFNPIESAAVSTAELVRRPFEGRRKAREAR